MHSTHNTWCIRAEFANRDFTLNKSRPQWGKTTQPTSETEIDETDRVRKSESLFIGIHDKILCIHSRTQYPVFYLMLLFDALHGDHEICHHSNFSCGIMRKAIYAPLFGVYYSLSSLNRQSLGWCARRSLLSKLSIRSSNRWYYAIIGIYLFYSSCESAQIKMLQNLIHKVMMNKYFATDNVKIVTQIKFFSDLAGAMVHDEGSICAATLYSYSWLVRSFGYDLMIFSKLLLSQHPFVASSSYVFFLLIMMIWLLYILVNRMHIIISLGQNQHMYICSMLFATV